MVSITELDDDEQVIKIFLSLSESISSADTSNNVTTNINLLEEKLGGPSGVISYLLPRLWLLSGYIKGDGALSILTYLVENKPADYMAATASSVRQSISTTFNQMSDIDEQNNKVDSDNLILALSKLLIGSDDKVSVSTDGQASLLELCKYDANNNNCNEVSKRVLTTIDTLWYHLKKQDNQREASTSQIRIASLLIDICLLGEIEMGLALSIGIMDKLLHIALDHENNDPLLQISALDLLECLAAYPMNKTRADFLLGNDILRQGLLCLEGDPINGGAVLRLLTEICRVGVLSSTSINEATQGKFHLLLSGFQKALQNFHPQGELERLSYIYCISSLVGCCCTATDDDMNNILNDKSLLHGWLSLHSRATQPKLKSTVLSSLSQVVEPSLWKEVLESNNIVSRPSDSNVLQLYQQLGDANNGIDSAELILDSAQSPFVEERLGAYDLLRALVMRGNIVRLLLLQGSFIELLLNQDIESTIEGKKSKYKIVVALLESNANILGGLISNKALLTLQELKEGGPNFKTTTYELATE